MNNDVNNRGMKMGCNNELLSSLNVIIVKSSPYENKGILRHYHYWSDPKLGLGIVAIRIITFIFHSCMKILYLPWDSKIKKHLIRRYMVEYIIANTLKFLVITITGL